MKTLTIELYNVKESNENLILQLDEQKTYFDSHFFKMQELLKEVEEDNKKLNHENQMLNAQIIDENSEKEQQLIYY